MHSKSFEQLIGAGIKVKKLYSWLSWFGVNVNQSLSLSFESSFCAGSYVTTAVVCFCLSLSLSFSLSLALPFQPIGCCWHHKSRGC